MVDRIEVAREIAATPEVVWALVSDLPRMGDWSPENDGGEWVKGATGPAVGGELDPAETTIAEGFQANGYRTGVSAPVEDVLDRLQSQLDAKRKTLGR